MTYSVESLKDWTWDFLTKQWDKSFDFLKDYVIQNKTSKVPASFINRNGFNLGTWVQVQRRSKPKLSLNQISLLNSLPDWKWEVFSENWELGFNNLLQYFSEKGDCLVPKSYKSETQFPLGNWVHRQRTNRSDLSKERQDRLSQIEGWSWDPLGDAWNKGFLSLVEYQISNGDCLVNWKYKTPSGFKLGQWVAVQRRGLLTSERKIRLESLKGWAWVVTNTQ